MIAAFLLWCGHRKCAMDAMELFTFRRTQNYDPLMGIDDSEEIDEDAPAPPFKMDKKQACQFSFSYCLFLTDSRPLF
jgi:hypothetical protein